MNIIDGYILVVLDIEGCFCKLDIGIFFLKDIWIIWD